MGMWESEPVYAVTCDEPGCCNCGPEASSERRAKLDALDPDEGWGEVDGKLYCPEHLVKAKRMAQKWARR
jgi:hypothetical protein